MVKQPLKAVDSRDVVGLPCVRIVDPSLDRLNEVRLAVRFASPVAEYAAEFLIAFSHDASRKPPHS